MNLLIFGSSITWGAWDEKGGWAQRIKRWADHKAMKSTTDEYVAVYCLGVSGDNTDDLLSRFENEVIARLDESEETVVLIEIGINDSQYVLADQVNRIPLKIYKQNLKKLVTICRELDTKVIFVGLTPVDDDKVDPIPWKLECAYRLELVKQYENALQIVALDTKAPFIEVMSKFLEINYQSLLDDGLHPNTKGHELIFETVLDYLERKEILA